MLGWNPCADGQQNPGMKVGTHTGGLEELSIFALPHLKPATVTEWADREIEPGVNEQVKQMTELWFHSECSAINLE